jgi:bifunctional non-homologous end joining protein LigD
MKKGKPEPLALYIEKRAAPTPEPFAESLPWRVGPGGQGLRLAPGALGVFVVHMHSAQRLHYDLRISCGGALLSFAVPRGPSLDPDVKHLAVQTEHHPLSYLEFEAVIPQGSYGAGPMIVWDRGSVTPLNEPLEEQLVGGKHGGAKLDFVLTGHKLRGRFSLIRVASRGRDRGKGRASTAARGPLARAESKEFLLLKKRDAFARPGARVDEEFPHSVLSGLRIEELDEQVRSLHAKSDGDKPSGPQVFAAIDGIFVQIEKHGAIVTLRLLDTLEDVTGFYPELLASIRALRCDSCVLHAVMVFLHPVSSFELAFQERLASLSEGSARFLGDRAMLALVYAVRGAEDTQWPGWLPAFGQVRMMPLFDDGDPSFLQLCKEANVAGHFVMQGGTEKAVWVSHDESRKSVTSAAHWLPESGPERQTHAEKPQEARMTNRAKVFFPKHGITKGEVLDHYLASASELLPFLRDRPVLLTRYPDGVEGKSFFQWNVPKGYGGPSLEMLSEDEAGKPKVRRGFLLNSTAALVSVVNLGCLPLHVLPWVQDAPRWCQYLVVDIDVKQHSLAAAIPAVQMLGRLLRQLGLTGFPKTSGQSGLHVLVSLGVAPTPEADNDAVARALATLLCECMVREFPEVLTTERKVSARGKRVFLDAGQTGVRRSIAAPFAVRATEDATFSMPLAWDEVAAGLEPGHFNLRSNFSGRKVWPSEFWKHAPDLAKCIEALSQRLQ